MDANREDRPGINPPFLLDIAREAARLCPTLATDGCRNPTPGEVAPFLASIPFLETRSLERNHPEGSAFRVLPGKVVLRVHAPGCRIREETVEVARGDRPTTVEILLQPLGRAEGEGGEPTEN